MPTITPRLKPARADGRRLVTFRYRHGAAAEAVITTGVAVRPECWDATTRTVHARAPGTRATKDNPADPYAGQDTLAIGRVYTALSEAVEDLKKEPGGHAPERVKAHVLAALRGEDADAPELGPLAVDYLREVIARRAPDISSETARRYANTVTHLRRYAPRVRINEMDRVWLDDYLARMRTAGLAQNTLWQDAKALRMMLRDADRRGHATPGAHRVYGGWMPRKGKPETYSLTVGEVAALREVADLPERLAAVRDLFLFAAATGMRYSELADLTDRAEWDLSPGRAQVRFHARKTNTWKIVPLSAEARDVLAVRGGALPRVPSNQKCNAYLKEVGPLAGLTRTVPMTRTGKPVALAESLSMHDARRTFATLACRAGVPLATIMGLTGHASERQLREYINLTDGAAAEDARRHPHFA